MKFVDYLFLVRSDLWRYCGKANLRSGLAAMLLPGFCYSFWMRTCAYLRRHALLRCIAYLPAKLLLRHYKFKYGIAIRETTSIGPGLFIGHFGGIVVNEDVVLGRNCNLSQDVTLGESVRGARKGSPVLGDNVYVGPGAKIIGKVVIGDHAAIGANCVVTHDVPPHAVVGGVPGRVISMAGSEGYVNRTDYA